MILLLLRLVVGLSLLYSLVLFCMMIGQRRLLFPAGLRRNDLGRAKKHDALPERMREIRVKTGDNLLLRAWYAPPVDVAQPVLLHFHGNGGIMEDRAGKLAPFAARGYGLLMLEWRGYGGNKGRPSESGLYADAAGALAFLHKEDIALARVILWGESLGTGVAVQAAVTCAALERPVKGVILEAPYSAITEVAAARYPWLPVRLMMRDRFDTASRIRFANAPILIIHGERDAVVPVHHGRHLLEIAALPKKAWFAAEGGHMDLFEHGAADVVSNFILSLCQAPP